MDGLTLSAVETQTAEDPTEDTSAQVQGEDTEPGHMHTGCEENERSRRETKWEMPNQGTESTLLSSGEAAGVLVPDEPDDAENLPPLAEAVGIEVTQLTQDEEEFESPAFVDDAWVKKTGIKLVVFDFDKTITR